MGEEELMNEILNSDVAEEEFVAGIVGQLEAPTLSAGLRASNGAPEKQKKIASWEEVVRLAKNRRELGAVVGRRLERCVEVCTRALNEAQGAPELRAALRNVAAAARAAGEADEKRRSTDDASDRALESLGKPVSDGGAWVGSSSLEAACTRARAEGRAEALRALSERERLREKCALYRARVAELEGDLRDLRESTMSEVSLDDGPTDELRSRLAIAERRLAALVGTERYARLSALERELEERGHIIAALRDALDVLPDDDNARRPDEESPNTRRNDFPPPAPPKRDDVCPPKLDLTPVACMPSTSLASDFEEEEEDDDAPSAPVPARRDEDSLLLLHLAPRKLDDEEKDEGDSGRLEESDDFVQLDEDTFIV
ncbi:hypothetical protein CTAYLR_004718 [Chrysophaeum taylorii]|uniref:Uncharacterized protein n=1 Tax=Chrysophaeum taylorii TaxID=2483200 RepID=A0AAD7XKQ7_9STRA|nr:hypothetical protein CTAYLR_004718 [Chrysophaeum taylorii]